MRNLLHANINVHSGILIAKLAIYGIKCIENLQSHCANMTFSEEVDMTGLFNRSHIKKKNMQLITLKYSRMHMLCKFLWGVPTQKFN